MSEMKYTEEHEWLRLEDDGTVTLGISNYAQEQLGDVVFVELPEVGKSVEAGAEAAVVESVKAAGEVKTPLSGEVIEVNGQLSDEPELVNSSPEGDGWFMKIKPESTDELTNLMDASSYEDYISKL